MKNKKRMKIQKNYWGIAFCAVLLAAGCTQNETLPGGGGGKDMQAPLVITTAGIEPEVINTRTATELGKGASMGLFLSNVPGSSDYAPQDNVRYKHTAAGWKFQGAAEDGIFLNLSDCFLCAYYPYDASVTSDTGIRLTPHVLAPGEALPAYAANQRINIANNNVTFSMKQAYSWLVLNIKRDNFEEITLSEVSLINNGLNKEAVIDIVNDAAMHSTPADMGRLSFTGDILLPRGGSVIRDIAVPPSDPLTGGLKVAVKVKEFGDKVLSTTLAGLTRLEQGYKYEVTLTVNGTELGVSSVKVLPWTVTTVNNEGQELVPEPSPVIPDIQVPASDINLGGSACSDQDKSDLSLLIWARGNLKSTGNGSVSDYVWTTPTDYGYYYTFMSTYTGNTSQNGTDPCTKLNPNQYGTGWRTPSRNELEKLSRCTDKQLVSNNGVMGMWFMNNPYGLFLPAAGGRNNNVGSGTSPTGNPRTYGYYWSSDGYNSAYGYNLYFYSGYANIGNHYERPHGFSVRCVKGNQQ